YMCGCHATRIAIQVHEAMHTLLLQENALCCLQCMRRMDRLGCAGIRGAQQQEIRAVDHADAAGQRLVMLLRQVLDAPHAVMTGAGQAPQEMLHLAVVAEWRVGARVSALLLDLTLHIEAGAEFRPAVDAADPEGGSGGGIGVGSVYWNAGFLPGDALRAACNEPARLHS